MKLSTKTEQILRKFDELADMLAFYTDGNQQIKDQFTEIRVFIQELGMESKKDRIRFAKKLKSIWEKENNDDN